MVKRQREKQYQSARENREYSQLRSSGGSSSSGQQQQQQQQQQQRRLPFSHCALTLTPYETPVCNRHGVVFENTALLPFLMQHKMDPVTGEPMSISKNNNDVITLVMDKDEEGRWCCPILNKPFMDHTKIVAVLQPDNNNDNNNNNNSINQAHVYSYEAYQELNVKAKNYHDLISGVEFDKKKHVLVLNDPDNETLNRLRDINQFYHIRHSSSSGGSSSSGSADNKQGGGANTNNNNNNNNNVRYSVTATRIMDQLKKKKQASITAAAEANNNNNNKTTHSTTTVAVAAAAATLETTTLILVHDGQQQQQQQQQQQRVPILSIDVGGALQSTATTSNQTASSFTSTTTAHNNNVIVTSDLERTATLEEVLQSQFQVMRQRRQQRQHQRNPNKKPNNNSNNNNKGLVRMQTTLGTLVLELHCDIVPRTCTNFLGLCRAGAYDGTVFHRLIKSFMIQGGGSYSNSSSKKKKKKGDDKNDANTKEEEEEETSLWGDAFVDEFDDRLKHSGRGILSMANAGPNTNKRQFFITFKSCGHLDRKHSVFGKVVDGMEVLQKMEQVPTDKKNDRPMSEIKIIQMDILNDPAKQARELEEQRIMELVRARRRHHQAKMMMMMTAVQNKRGGSQKLAAATTTTTTTTNSDDSSSANEVGRFLKDRLKKQSSATTATAAFSTKGLTQEQKPSRLPPPPKKTKFTNFSGW